MNVIFKYYAVNLKGKTIKGKYDGESIDELSLLLRNKGYFLYNFQVERKSFIRIFCSKPSFRDLSTLCNTLGTMIAVGIPISQILSMLMENCSNKQIKDSLNGIKKNLSIGESIYESMKRFSEVYPLFLLEMIRVGEEGGKLDSVLKDMSEYYEKQHKVFMKIKTALIYPLIVLIVSILIAIFLVIKIVPQFVDLLTSLGGELPIITKILLYFCAFIKSNFFTICILFVLSCFLCFKLLKTPNGKIYFDKIKMKIPFFNKFYDKFIISRFAIAMGILISSGFGIIKALEITSSVLENRIMESRIYNSIEDIKKGDSIYNSFRNQGIGNNLFLSLVRTGEETGNLDYMLTKVGKIFANDVEENLKKMITFIEPMVILFLTFFIGVFIIAALMPVLSIMDSISYYNNLLYREV